MPGFLRRGSVRGALVIAGVFLAVPAPAALATDVTVTFDDLTAGTTVSTQYAGRGITFGPSVTGQTQPTASRPVVAAVGTSAASSGDRVGRVQRFCTSSECVGTAETWAQFSAGQARVRVAVGAFGTVSNTITLTAFNGSGAQVAQAQASVPAGSFRTPLSVSTSTAVIRFVRLRGSTLGTFGIDNLFTSTTLGSGADYSISVPFGPHVVQQGSSATIPVTLTRRNSSGTIRVSASGLPPGATIPAVDSTLATASSTATTTTVNLRLSAGTNAPPAIDTTVTFTATPLSAAAGSGTRSLTARVRLVVLYDLRITGVEPTQGIQKDAFTTFVGTGVQRYAGVPLQYNGRTVVRVYANTPRGGFSVPGVGARLFGFDSSGSPLPGSPLFPDRGSRTVVAAANTSPTLAERTNPGAAWTFTLPLSWTGFGRPSPSNAFVQQFFNTRLRAQLTPPAGSVAFHECIGCTANDVLTVTEVGYSPTCCVAISSAIITARGGTTPRPVGPILGPALNVTPLEVDLRPYGATLDLSDKLETRPDGSVGINRSAAYDALARFNQDLGAGEVALGILSPEFPDASGQFGLAVFNDVATRPLTSTAHQLAHALGRPDASPSCSGNGEPWPPDETGLLQGIGLDRTATSPYRVLVTAAGAEIPSQPLPTAEGGGNLRASYDFMSLCATEANAWISVKGWTDTITRWPRGDAATQLRAAASPGLHVNAGADAAGAVTIASVRPRVPTAQRGLGPTPYRLVVRDAQGAVLADVPVGGRAVHSSRGGGGHTFLTGFAPVEPARAQRVEIVREGSVVSQRRRSASSPTGAFTRPRRGALVGRGERLTIGWRAADADGDRVEATVEWSAKGGRPGTWRTVFLGASGTSVALPSEYFGGSERAFLRLRLNDGFNETVVLSPPFRTIHRAPTVRIAAPRPGTSVRRDATLVLSATARNEAGQPIGGGALRWFEGRRRLGRGDSLRLTRLRPGTHRVRVVATDAAGRRAAASVRVRVRAVAPSFAVLRAPRQVSRRARSVVLRVAASLRSRLRVRGGSRRVTARVGLAPRTIRVPIARRPGLLRLRLTLSADRRTRTARVDVDRR